jgi:molecular chaperone HscB
LWLRNLLLCLTNPESSARERIDGTAHEHAFAERALKRCLTIISLGRQPIMSEPTRDYFEFFSLDRKLVINADDLQSRFYQLSRQWHPDRFSRRPIEEQNQSLEATSLLNDGYRTLKDPVKRAEYLLTQEGFPIGEQRSKDVPPELLEEVFELNMMLEELKAGDETARPQLEQARASFLTMRGGLDQDLMKLFHRYDASTAGSETAKQALHEIRSLLNRRRYIENLVRDVDRALSPALSSAQTAEDKA